MLTQGANCTTLKIFPKYDIQNFAHILQMLDSGYNPLPVLKNPPPPTPFWTHTYLNVPFS